MMKATNRRYFAQEAASRLIQMVKDESSDSGDNSIQSEEDCEFDVVKDVAEMTDDEND